MAGSVGPECNRAGQCKCRPQYGGSKCNRCKSSLFYAFPYCKRKFTRFLICFQFIHSYSHSFIYSFIQWFIYLFIHSFILPFFYIFTHSCIHSLIYSFSCQFMSLLIHWFIEWSIPSFIHSFVRWGFLRWLLYFSTACNCNPEGAFGQFCLSQTGQCQCLSNFRGRKCNMCQVGFYDFPRCIACTCNAAGIKDAGKNGSSGCFPGEKVCMFLDGYILIKWKDLWICEWLNE